MVVRVQDVPPPPAYQRPPGGLAAVCARALVTLVAMLKKEDSDTGDEDPGNRNLQSVKSM